MAIREVADTQVVVDIDLYQQLLYGIKADTPLWERAIAVTRQWAEDHPDLFESGAHYCPDSSIQVFEFRSKGSSRP